jgi:hypothetical protein
MLVAAWHRVRQFFGALRPRVEPASRAEAYAWLDEPLRPAFESMMLRDQQHGIIVYQRVRAASSTDDRALFAAALLHDCGKGRVALWQRVAHVLLDATGPRLERAIARDDGAAWRQAFWRLRHHPELGARMVERLGADPDVVRMIREQDIESPDERLALLQAADEA